MEPAEIHSFRSKGVSKIPGYCVNVGARIARRDTYDELTCERWHQQLAALFPLVFKEDRHGLTAVQNASQACGATVQLDQNSTRRGFCNCATDDDGQLLDVVEHRVLEPDAYVGKDNELRLQDSDAMDVGIRAEKQRRTSVLRNHGLVAGCHQLDG